MIGTESFTIDYKEFIKGMSTSPDIADGGFSDETTGINLLTKPGLIYGPAQATAVTTAPTGKIIASCGTNANISGSNDKYFLGNNGASGGTYYTYNGTNLSLVKTDATASVYGDGISDMVAFGSYVWATTKSNLVRWDGTSGTGASFVTDYWTNAAYLNKSAMENGFSQPHPLLVFEKRLWIGDGKYLHALSENGTTLAYQALTFGDNEYVYALSIDPASGKMLISTSEGRGNLSNTYPVRNRIYIWDGFSALPNRSILVEDLVTAFYPLSSVVYVAYGRNLGYFTGSGIEFLRVLKNVNFDFSSLVYKHRITSIGKNLYVADGSQVLCFGEIIGKQPKVFHYAYKNTPTSTARQISCLTALGNTAFGNVSKLGIACEDGTSGAGPFHLYSFGILDRATSQNHLLYSNRYLFPRPVNIRNIRVVFDGNVPTSGGTLGFISYVDEIGSSTLNDIISNSTATPWVDLASVPNDPVNSFKCIVEYATTSTPFGVRSVIVSYDIAE